uniref:non-specific serine/threonine protein kinase n=1 Tax=Ciona savignyi TaxID=51511 RepID=H2Y4G9_CIOSA
MKKLKHPNLIRLYELFQVSSKLYFTLEWGGHGDLLQYIRLRGALKETESRKYFREMCFGVEYMHQLGVVHRDLKCENLLLSKKNTIKIADFGFAREIGANETSKTYCGSAAYAAPELLQGIPYTGTIADIWSLGVILYIMSCSSMPFRDANIKTLLKDQKDKLHIPSSVVATLNSSLKELMKKIMCFDLHKRFMMREIKAHAWFHKHGSDDQPADNNDNDTHEVAAETSGTKS